MAIPLTGAGSLGVRWGHLIGWANDLLAEQGAAATTNVLSGAQPATRLAQVQGDYAAGTADYADVAGLAPAVASFQSPGSLTSFLQGLFQNTLVTMAGADVDLAQNTVSYALQLLVQEMTLNSNTVSQNASAVGAQTNVGTPTGNPTFVFSVTDPAGRNQQYVYPETLTATITRDSQGGATAGQESWALTGQNAQTNKLAFDWLAATHGSGASVSGALVDGSAGNQGGNANLSVNGDFRTYTNVDYPDNWVITTGAATTNVANSSGSQSYLTGGGSVQLKGDGATPVGIAQPFGTAQSTAAGAGGSPAVLAAAVANNAVYCVSLYWKNSNASPATGVLRVSVTNAAGTIQQDDAGTNLSATANLAGTADTNWHQLTLVFRLPKVLPSAVRLRIDQSTAVENAKSVYVANVAVTQMQQLYSGGPYVAGFRGATNPNASGVAPDSWTFAVTNTTGALQVGIWRLLDPANVPQAAGGSPYFTPGNGYVLPVAADGAATMKNALVA